MAELSRFFGIIIRMFAEHGGRHHTSHFHAVYQEHEAVFTINPVQILSGSMPNKTTKTGSGMGGNSLGRLIVRMDIIGWRQKTILYRTA